MTIMKALRTGPAAPLTAVQASIFPGIFASLILSGCASPPSPISVSPQDASVRIGGSIAMSGRQNGIVIAGGTWNVAGGMQNGTITASGLYTPPSVMPSANRVTIGYENLGQTTSSEIAVLNPLPTIGAVEPALLQELSNAVVLTGIGFVSGSAVIQDGVAVPTAVMDATHLQATIKVPNLAVASTSISVLNPAPGAVESSPLTVPVAIAPLLVSPSDPSVRLGSSLQLTATQQGKGVGGGSWSVAGDSSRGTISSEGVYVPPNLLPSPNTANIICSALGQSASATISLLNPPPVIASVSPATLDQISNPVVIMGSGFVNGSQVVAEGTPVSTTFLDSTHLSVTLNLANKNVTKLEIAVANPGPGASVSPQRIVPASVLPLSISVSHAALRVGVHIVLSGVQGGAIVTGGEWFVVGGPTFGTVDQTGKYVAPSQVPIPNSVAITYAALGQTASTTITLLNPQPVVAGITPNILNQMSTQVVITGTGFVSGSRATVNGIEVATTLIDPTRLAAAIKLSSENQTSVILNVSNPQPGASESAPFILPALVLPLTISPEYGSVRIGDTVTLSGMQNGSPVTGGLWSVVSGPGSGTIDQNGVYTPALSLPKSGATTVLYKALEQTATATLQILNPVPEINQVAPAFLTSFSNDVVITGAGFTQGSQIFIGGSPAATTFQDATHLKTMVIVPTNTITSIDLAVANPDPGAVQGPETKIPVRIAPLSISPTTLTGGNLAATLTQPGMPPNTTVTMNGVPLATTVTDDSTVKVSGYLPYWTSGTATFALLPGATASPFGVANVPIAPTAVSYDVASRFAMQAGFGPRHDIIEHIQQVGLEAFVDEQIKMPPDVYLDPVNGRRDFLLHIVNNNTQLRLRTAWAFQSFIPEQGIFQQQSVLPWEQTLEADAFTNFRQIMSDAASDPNVTTLLNLPGNRAPRSPTEHPNQNFARELLQLFTIGPVMLNEDGSVQTDSSGNPISSYGEDTVLDLSRVFTGWTYAPVINRAFTAYNIDYSQKLVSLDWQHDHGSKTIFGSTVIAANQTADQEREQALDAIFNHTNVPPFISRRLIQRLVKSQPSPAYIERIATVFKDDGSGTRGNLAAVIKAILLDQEARAGDLQPANDDGYIQDPLFAEVFAMILLDINKTDGSASYYPDQLGEPWWFTHSVFAYYSPDYVIPGTNLISPESQLLTSTLVVQRSQLLWGMINGSQVGFEPWLATWLNSTFPTLPAFVEALDHLLYHGRMSASERNAIMKYCGDLTDVRSQLRAALFLALNNDSYTVVQ